MDRRNFLKLIASFKKNTLKYMSKPGKIIYGPDDKVFIGNRGSYLYWDGDNLSIKGHI